MKLSTRASGWFIALAVLILRRCCRIRLHDDPRPGLRKVAILHLLRPALASNCRRHRRRARHRGHGSRSDDGALLIPCLRARGILPIRGSNGQTNGDKGGLAAIEAMIQHVAGGSPGYLAVDGPRGPRNRVHKGIAVLSQRTGAAVINMVAVPSRRWIFTHAWDRFQIPKPFATIHGYFGEPLFYREGEGVEHYRKRIETSLNDLERQHDPVESKLAAAATLRRQDAKLS